MDEIFFSCLMMTKCPYQGCPKIWPVPGCDSRRLHDARVTASWVSSLPLNPPEVPSASPRSWPSPGPRPARSSSRSTCPSVRDPRVTERCVPSLAWIRASETNPRVAEARGLARPETRPASAPIDFARDASTGRHRTSSRPSRGDRRTGASTLNGAKTQHAREPVGTKRPARISSPRFAETLTGNASVPSSASTHQAVSSPTR